MAFPEKEAAKLLAKCHRRCCICHKFCGVKIELAHIEQRADTHNDTIENAIPVCFECHAEIGLYNPRHPKGKRFSEAELRLHRKQWLQICRARPEALLSAPTVAEAGSIERLIHELEFNLEVTNLRKTDETGCPFEVEQFGRALGDGTYSILDDDRRAKLRRAYIYMKRANTNIGSLMSGQPTGFGEARIEAQCSVGAARGHIKEALDALKAGPE